MHSVFALASLFAAVQARTLDNYYNNFEVSNFAATTDKCEFEVALAPGYSTSCSCEYEHGFQAVPVTKCEDKDVAFEIVYEVVEEKKEPTVELYVYTDYSEDDKLGGYHSIPSEQLVNNNYGKQVNTIYNGPTQFNIAVENLQINSEVNEIDVEAAIGKIDVDTGKDGKYGH